MAVLIKGKDSEDNERYVNVEVLEDGSCALKTTATIGTLEIGSVSVVNYFSGATASRKEIINSSSASTIEFDTAVSEIHLFNASETATIFLEFDGSTEATTDSFPLLPKTYYIINLRKQATETISAISDEDGADLRIICLTTSA